MAQSSKKTRGRQKIEIKRIENEENRLVTFSKRKAGIYKKASELVTLTGSEVGVLMFSPTGKPHSFGHPSVEAISNRFLGVDVPQQDSIHSLMEAHRQVRINELNQQHNDHLHQLDTAKERGKMLEEMTRERSPGWWEAPMDKLNMNELHQMDAAFQELSMKLLIKLNDRASSSGPFLNN